MKITWKFHIETIAVKALRVFISIYPILKIECLSVGTKLTLYKVLIGSAVTCACIVWGFATDSYLLKLQRLQNNVLCTICLDYSQNLVMSPGRSQRQD